ncbi:MAG: hypothetical protein C0594_11135, partial [Marinilabiliales bacterium]
TYPTPDCINNFTLTLTQVAPTCTDGIQNQGETGVDCGGPCPACGVGDDCNSPEVISSLPFSSSNTTCGHGDDYSSADACGSSYLNGEDYIYEYTPTSDEIVSIDLTNTDTYTGILVFDGCPDDPNTNCIGGGTSSAGNPSFCGELLEAGTTYYFAVSTYPTPDCTPFDIDINTTPVTVVNTCSGTFTDPGGGGNNSSYPACDHQVYVYCPDQPGYLMQMDFTDFDVEGGYDYLCIYDGDNVNATTLGCWDNDVPVAGIVQATQTNTSGCLTFEFHSDATDADNNGWSADINCTYPCQLVQAESTGNAYIDLCQGDTYTFNGSGSYPDNGTYYTQSDATSTFEWDIDGTTYSGSSVTVTFPDEGGYDIDLTVIDVNGCYNTNQIGQRVRVSTTPSFVGTTAIPTPICLGQTVDLSGVITPTPWEQTAQQIIAGTTFLPDGSGVSYSTSATYNIFSPGQTLDNVADLMDVCLNLEHSYVGDLSISLECPTGETVDLIIYSSLDNLDSEFLGEPVDVDGDLTQGTGYDYCFSPSSHNGTWDDAAAAGYTNTYTDNAGNDYTSHVYIPADTYEIKGNWADLLGCELNGDWTIHVTDNLSSDNGYIFSWGIDFDPAIIPSPWGFVPNYSSAGEWSGPDVVAPTGDNYTVTPTTIGTHDYTYTVTDDYGCSYDTTISVVVTGLTLSITSTPPTCAGYDNATATVTVDAGGTPKYDYIWSDGTTVANQNSNSNTLSGLTAGTYDVTVVDNNGCEGYASVTIVDPPGMTLTMSGIPTTCGLDNGTATATITASTLKYDYVWSNGSSTLNQNGLTNSINPVAAGTYTVTVTDDSGCTITDSFVVDPSTGVTAMYTGLSNSCLNPATTYIFDNTSTASALATYSWDFGDGSTSTEFEPTYTYPSAGTYTVTLTVNDGACFDDYSVDVTIFPEVTANITASDPLCPGTATGSATASVITGSSPYGYNWSPSGYTGDGTATYSDLEDGTYTVTITDANLCTGTSSVTLTDPDPIVLSASRTNVNCAGECTGTATVSVVSGGTGSFTYAWSGGAGNTASVSGLCAGTYTVTVTDDNNCEATTSVVITEPATALSSTVSATDETCYGACDGTATASPSGGTSPYSYSWDDPSSQASATASGLCAGTYTATITDNNNCEFVVSTDVVSPDPMVIAVSTTQLDCNGDCDGTATVDVNGGTAPYDFEWSNNDLTQDISGLCAGIYTVTVTDDNGCTAPISTPPITTCFEITDILVNSCGGSQEGPNE